MSNPIIRPSLAIKSLRHTQYKNTAYAVAELLDNAIQAGANRVELICLEAQSVVTVKNMYRLKEIAVLDNGCGMDKETLARALEIGNGSRLDPANQTGIGRFGMGLPMSSISQCKRVEVWTWTNGVENALYSYLDLGEIEHDGLTEVPEPRRKEVPVRLQNIGRLTIGESGTLVLWSHLDKCQWTSAEPLFKNGGNLIGRIYRRQLAAGKLKIRFIRTREGIGYGKDDEQYVLPNDPLYLMSNTSCPAPFTSKPMFQPVGTEIVNVPLTITIGAREVIRQYPVTIRFARAKDEARHGFDRDAGGLPHGKHAAQNVGVSLMRADRELELEEGFVSRHTPATERWWGVEVEFPPALDEVFGVTHTKQSATNFSALVRGSEIDEIKTMEDVNRRRAERDGDPQAHLFEIAYKIEQGIREMRQQITAQTAGTRSSGGQGSANSDGETTGIQLSVKPLPENIGSRVTRERRDNGYVGASDAGEGEPPVVRVQKVAKGLKDIGFDDERANSEAEDVIRNNYKYKISHAALDSSAFFALDNIGGVLLIVLNTNHPAYTKLFQVLEEDSVEATTGMLRDRLADATDALKLLLEAWARYEDELPKDGPDKRIARKVREDWGRMAEAFLADQ